MRKPLHHRNSLLTVGLVALLSIANGGIAHGQSTYNYVTTRVPQVEGKYTEADLAGLSRTTLQQATTYYDGLNRPVQQVGKEASPTGNDVVLPMEYDAMGRMTKAYLPYEASTGTGLYHADALASGSTASQQALFYGRTSDKVADDVAPFAQTIFESSTLGRVTERGAVGNAWQPGMAEPHTIRTEYRNNFLSEDIKKFAFDYNANKPVCTGTFDESTLSVTVTRDEHDANTYEFRDTWGRVIAKATQLNRYQYATIYYVYDDADNLRLVIRLANSLKTGSYLF